MLIRQMLDLSTAHLDPDSTEWLSTSAGEGRSVMKGAHGWWTPVYDQAGIGSLLRHPPVLEAIFAFARAHGADCILFDADAGAVSDLPTFEEG